MNKWYDITAQSSKVAKIKMHGVIGGGFFEEGVTAERVSEDLEEIASIKADTIEIDLKSGGGSALHGIEIYNMLKANPAKIKIKGNVLVGSIASVIAMAADENEFSMVDNGFFLIHEGRMPSGGTANQLRKDADMIESFNDTIASIYADNLSITKKEAFAIMAINNGEGELITAKQAKSRGYVDSVFKPSRGNATASITQDQLTEFKINAKIETNMSEQNENVEEVAEVIENNTEKAFNLSEVTAKIVDAVKAAITPVNIEEVVEDVEAIEEVDVEALVLKEVEAVKADFDEKIKVEADKAVALQAKLDVANAKSIEPSGSDAELDSDKVVLTNSDVAAEQFINSLTYSEKLQFEANENKK